MPNIIFQQVSSDYAKSNAGKTLDHPVAIKYLKKYLSPEKFQELQELFPDGSVYIWGAKLERFHQIPKMSPNRSIVLFRRGKEVFRVGKITAIFINEELARNLWGSACKETWGIIYLMKKVLKVSIDASKVNKLVGRKMNDHWQGMTAIGGEQATAAINLVKSYLENKNE